MKINYYINHFSSPQEVSKINDAMNKVHSIIDSRNLSHLFKHVDFTIEIYVKNLVNPNIVALTHFSSRVEAYKVLEYHNMHISIALADVLLAAPVSVLVYYLIHELLHCDQIGRGDLVFLDNGTVIYQGRVNDLVKIDGHGSVPLPSSDPLNNAAMQYEHDVDAILADIFGYGLLYDLYVGIILATVKPFVKYFNLHDNIYDRSCIVFRDKDSMMRCLESWRTNGN